MDINEAIKILKTEWQCLEFQITGVAQCLDKDACDDCKYKPVSFGKQIECHEKAIKCLEAWNKIKEQIEEEKSYAHIDYNGYKNDVLKFDPYYIDGDYPLPKDYFGHGMERAEDIINKYLSEDIRYEEST